MELNKLYERYQKGESDIALAQEVNKSVTVLWQAFKNAGIIEAAKNKHSLEKWKAEYENYLNGKSVERIAKELNCRPATVYNNFTQFGYKITPRVLRSKESFYEDLANGLNINELALKYNYTLTYVRHLIRQKKRADGLL